MKRKIQTEKHLNFMVILGGIVLCCVAIYFLFMAINDIALEKKEGYATVAGKGYREAGRTYTTQVIGGRAHTIPQSTPEMYILMLDIAGRQIECAVSRDLYGMINAGEKVTVVYQRRRITGGLQVLDVIRDL